MQVREELGGTGVIVATFDDEPLPVVPSLAQHQKKEREEQARLLAEAEAKMTAAHAKKGSSGRSV